MNISPSRLLCFSRQFERYYTRQFAPLLEETGLSVREIHVLLFLVNNPAFDTARDVAELRGLGKSQVSQAVELLWGRGMLVRNPDRTDRRVVHLALTETGAALALRARAIQEDCGRALLAGLPEEDKAAFYRLLNKVLDQAEKTIKEEIQP